jgi:polysaccharide biosynthesis/export protein
LLHSFLNLNEKPIFAYKVSIMKKIFLLILFLFSAIFVSCVPSKDLIYLQNKNNSAEQNLVSPVNSKPYRIQTNDVLSISIKTIDPKIDALFNTTTGSVVVKDPQSLYFDGYNVDDHGNIRIPLVGEVNVLGFTIDETRKKLEEKLLSEYFKKESNLFVNVKLAGFRYTINGEVASPGTKSLLQDKVNILEAVANAGDITTTGNRKDVVIVRQTPQGAEIHTIDLTDIKALQSPYYFLQPNDYVYVKPLKQKTWGTGKTGIESLGTIITLLSLITTTFLLLKK